MEQRSNKKIRNHLFIWIAFCVLTALGCFVFSRIEKNRFFTQLKELNLMYPEKEKIFADNFEFYQKNMQRDCLYLWIFLSVLSLVVVSVLYYLQKKNEQALVEYENHQLEDFIEQLGKFQKGDYTILNHDANVANNINGGENQWNHVWELLRALGHYFASLREELESEENSTKALISDISHQLKTPLSSLRMSHELSQEEDLTVEERREFVKQEELEIHRLETLLQELVNLSRLESHMIQICPRQSGIKKTITEAVNAIFARAQSKKIEIQVEMKEDVLVVHDEKWTVEAISNVLDNAIKYSPENTTILVKVEKLPNLILIDIEDEGIGIAQEDLHKIFHRFYRGKEAGRFCREGAGIGLYLSRRILEEEKGTISAKKKSKSGTIFQITLPLLPI